MDFFLFNQRRTTNLTSTEYFLKEIEDLTSNKKGKSIFQKITNFFEKKNRIFIESPSQVMNESSRGKWNNIIKKNKSEEKIRGEEEKQEPFPIKVNKKKE